MSEQVVQGQDTYERAVCFAGEAIRLRCLDPHAAKVAHFLFGPHLEAVAKHSPTVEVRVERDRHSGAFQLICNDRLETLVAETSDLELALVQLVQFQLISPALKTGMFHAASVVRNDRTILLPATAGSGKTTLTATLLSHGYGFLSDELTAIDNDGSADGFARPLNIKPGSLDLLRGNDRLRPHFARARTSAGITLLPWAREPSRQIRLASIVLPTYQAGARFELERLSAGRAAAALMSCLLNARNLPKGGIGLAGRLAAAVPVHRACYSRTQDMVDWLTTHLESAINTAKIPS